MSWPSRWELKYEHFRMFVFQFENSTENSESVGWVAITMVFGVVTSDDDVISPFTFAQSLNLNTEVYIK